MEKNDEAGMQTLVKILEEEAKKMMKWPKEKNAPNRQNKAGICRPYVLWVSFAVSLSSLSERKTEHHPHVCTQMLLICALLVRIECQS